MLNVFISDVYQILASFYTKLGMPFHLLMTISCKCFLLFLLDEHIRGITLLRRTSSFLYILGEGGGGWWVGRRRVVLISGSVIFYFFKG